MSDEQRKFEAWATLSGMSLFKTSDGDYTNMAVSTCWSSWQAANSENNYIQMLAKRNTPQPNRNPND